MTLSPPLDSILHFTKILTVPAPPCWIHGWAIPLWFSLKGVVEESDRKGAAEDDKGCHFSILVVSISITTDEWLLLTILVMKVYSKNTFISSNSAI